MKAKPNFKPCQIYRGAPKGRRPNMNKVWYVFYMFNENYHSPALKPKYKRIIIKDDINRLHTIDERQAKAEEIKANYDELLLMGMNPFKSYEENVETVQANRKIRGQHLSTVASVSLPSQPVKQYVEYMSVLSGIKWAIEKKISDNPKWRKGPPSGYQGVITFFQECCRKKEYIMRDLSEFSVLEARDVIQDMVNERGLGDHAYLKYKNIMFTVFAELKDWGKIQVNPFDFKSNKSKPAERAKEEFTAEERELIKREINAESPAFYSFLMVIFHTQIRPVEIARLQVKNINLSRQEIFLSREITKTNRDRYAIIPNALLPYLERLNLSELDSEMYIFGHNFLPEYRSPNLKKDRAIKIRDRATKLWEQIVKKRLNINKNMYWLKDEGINQKLDAGIDKKVVQLQAGHTSVEQTEKYASRNPRRKAIKIQLQNLGEDF